MAPTPAGNVLLADEIDEFIDPLAEAGFLTQGTMTDLSTLASSAGANDAVVTNPRPIIPDLNSLAESADAASSSGATTATADTAGEASKDGEEGKSKVFRIVDTNRLVRATSKSNAAKFAGAKANVVDADCDDVMALFDAQNPPEVVGTLEGKGKVFVHINGDSKRLVRGNKLSEVIKQLSPEIKVEPISAEELLEALSTGVTIENGVATK